MFASGTIKTALPGMDREVKENYQVVIQAKDMAGQMGGLSGTTTVSITLSDVNDSPPRFANRKMLLPSFLGILSFSEKRGNACTLLALLVRFFIAPECCDVSGPKALPQTKVNMRHPC